jgi:hypothetical protein
MKNIERVSVGFTKLDFRRKIFTYFINTSVFTDKLFARSAQY